MKTSNFINTVVCSLGLVAATTAWGLSPQLPKILYGTTTTVPPANQFAIATTLPPADNPRAKFVVVAKANEHEDLEVLAWHDTTSSLVSLTAHGVAYHQDVKTVAAAGLDSDRVVTADVNKKGVLSIHTWKVGPAGVDSLLGYRTPAWTAASKDVAIAAVSCNEVVTAYENLAGELIVEAFSIAPDGLPVPKKVAGKGPKVFEASIAVITPDEVITAAGDSGQSLWVETWKLDSAGVTLISQAETHNAVSDVCFVAPRPQTVAVGAGRTLEPPSGSALVQSAFTPVITPACQLQVYYWSISHTGALTLKSTTTPTEAGDFGEVAASMLPRNIPITSYTGGTGDDNVFIEWYTGFSLIDTTVANYGDPYGALNVASAPAGTNLSSLSLFDPYNAYFVSGGLFGPAESVPEGTLFVNVLSYPEAPLL